MDDTEVQITRHKRKLEDIRERALADGENREDDRRYLEAAIGSVYTTQGTSERDANPLQGIEGNIGSGEEGIYSGKATSRGTSEGIRSVDTTHQFATESTDTGHREIGTGKLASPLTEAEKIERDRELARQRKQRQRDREKLEKAQGNLSSNRDSDSDSVVTQNYQGSLVNNEDVSHFRLKLPSFQKKEPEKVKLFTKAEAEEAIEPMVAVVMTATGLLDDVLEIVVKGHEAVSIWQMDEDEATLWVQGHLKHAQKDQSAARVARKMIEIYDKLFTFKYLLSRATKTVSHVKEHGGFSFR